MTAWEQRMRAALLACEAQFHAYADHHLAKDPPDRDKAEINLQWAIDCHAAAIPPDTVVRR
jgi:hypothetical protein